MKKIALLGPKDWALGSINFFLKKHLSDKYDVCLLDWSYSAQVKFALGGSFDVVISEASIVNVEDIGHKVSSKTTIMPVFHHDPVKLNGTHFDENHEKNIGKHKVYAITNKISKSVFDRYGFSSEVLPIGVDDSFWGKRKIDSIKNIGICYRPSVALSPQYESVKRFWMFDEIRKKNQIKRVCYLGQRFSCRIRYLQGLRLGYMH